MNRGLKPKFTETMLKSQVKDLLNQLGCYNWPCTAGLGSHPGQPDRIAHIKGKVVYIECKLPNGKQSEKQIEFENICIADDIDYWLIRDISALEAKLKVLGVLR